MLSLRQLTALSIFLLTFLNSCITPSSGNSPDAVPGPISPSSTKALVLPGGGFSVPVFVGILDELEAQGWVPDIIFATCGSTLSASIYRFHATPEERLNFLTSETFHKILLSPQSRSGLGDLLYEGWDMKFDQNTREIPDFFKTTFFKMPQNLGTFELDHWTFPNQGPRLVYVGARTTLTPKDVGRKYKKNQSYFEKVLFTDPITALQLEEQGLTTHVSPHPRINPKAVVVTEWPVIQSIRASIAEPFLMDPLIVAEPDQQSTYTGSYIDLYPASYALAMAEEVIGIYPESPDELTEGSIRITYGNSPKTQREAYLKQPLHRWIDLTDRTKQEESKKMRLQYSFTSSSVVRGMGMENKVPEEIEEFRKIVLKQYEFGRARAAEALGTEIGSRNHVRKK